MPEGFVNFPVTKFCNFRVELLPQSQGSHMELMSSTNRHQISRSGSHHLSGKLPKYRHQVNIFSYLCQEGKMTLYVYLLCSSIIRITKKNIFMQYQEKMTKLVLFQHGLHKFFRLIQFTTWIIQILMSQGILKKKHLETML